MIKALRDRRFRAIGRSFGLSDYDVDRMIEAGLMAGFGYPDIIRIIDPQIKGKRQDFAVSDLADAEFFVKEWARRSENLHTEGGSSREG